MCMFIVKKGEPPHPKVNTLVRRIRTSGFFTVKAITKLVQISEYPWFTGF